MSGIRRAALRYAILVLVLLLASSLASDVFYSIREELSPGTIFGYIADDSDLRRKVSPDELNNLRYSFLTQGNPNSRYFNIESKTGVLSVGSRIDRETVCSFRPDCQLTVSAVVQSELGPFFHIINVHVEIVDVNDNPPTFLQDVFTVSIPENAALGVTYPLPTAFDKDTGTNNTVGDFGLAGPLVRDYFLISGHETFSLQSSRDELGNVQTALQLHSELDREQAAAYTILVGARDGGRPPLTGTLTVHVTVTDVNDNYPVFESYVYYVNVSETTRTDVPLVQIRATDADIGHNGNLTYSFSQLQPQDVLNLFRMETVTGTMYLARSVENHTGKIFELVVEAKDQGSPPKISRALVRVRVLDTINSRPEIYVDILSSTGEGRAEVSEYAEVGKVVAYVSVRDPDSGENGVTVCRLNTQDFELQPLNNQGQYKVILVTNLDREKTAQYDIAVGCTDFGFPPLENTAKFLVIVKDENDNAPVFSRRSYVTTIKENRTVGAVVAQLTVTDYDEGRNADVTFRVAGAYGDDFEILDNGTMIATVALDREVSEKLVVKVLAVDKGFPPLSGSATVFITLEDVNDQAPSFSDRRYSFSVAEDARPGTYVGIISADDGDVGRNAEVTFLPAPDQYSDTPATFVITRDGVVKTNVEMDREKVDVHFFAVVARDEGDPPLSSTATVTIHVDDVNDNVPVFLFPTEANDTLFIPHTFAPGTPITRVLAEDSDSGPNAALVYSCASANDSGLFGINSGTGDLYLHRYLSRSQTGLYVLRVAAHDEGTPQLSNQTLLFVDIYFDNSTLLESAQAVAPSKAVITALILVGVIVVVAGVAVTTLVCIRRSEARKKKNVSDDQQAAPGKLQGGYYIAPGVCESPAFGGVVTSSGRVGKPVPEQAGGSDNTVSGKDTSNLRTANPYVIMPPHSNYSDPEGPPEIIEISRNGLFHRTEEPYPEDFDGRADDSHFSTFRSQEGALSQGFRQNSLRRQSSEAVDEAKRADDTLSLSELSYQGSTSDSGRGGSEFDINNGASKEKGAAPVSSSPMPFKGNNSLGRPRDPDVSFTTFRGESPCSFRFDSDSDTLTRNPRHGNPRSSPLPLSPSLHLQPHARSLNCVAGTGSPGVHRSIPFGADSTSSDEANSTGRKSSLARRAVTPSGDILYDRGERNYSLPTERPYGGGLGGGARFPNGYVGSRSGAHGPPAFDPAFSLASAAALGAHPVHNHHAGPHVEFRGRNTYGNAAVPRRGVSDYVNTFADNDSDDETHVTAGKEPTEVEYLLPPYPEVAEEEEGEDHVTERSALNYTPRGKNQAHRKDGSYRSNWQSEV